MKKIFPHNYFSPALLICFTLSVSISFSQGKTLLQGQVKQSDGSPLRNSAVMLIQYNPATKMCTVVDSAYTDAAGKYKFDGSQQYYVLARPDESAVNELPTYFGNSLFAGKAASVSLNFGETVTADFSTSKKAPSNSGAASIGGNLSLGKNLNGASKTSVILADKDKNPIAVTTTNVNGDFKFKNLSHGTYYIMADLPGIDNTNPDLIFLDGMNPNKENLHFIYDDGSLTWVENSYTNIKDALVNKDNIYSLDLNSLQHDVVEKSLVLDPSGPKILSPHIGEFHNLESLSLNINGVDSLPAEIGKLSKLTTLNARLNWLASLPAEMAGLKNIRSLDLGKNRFKKFPGLLTGLASLENLDFESNAITTLPATISTLKNLKTLNLAGCFELVALPPQIGELTNLEELDLSNCIKIKSLPKELNNLKNLKVLNISGTKLSANSFKKAVPGCQVIETKK